MNILAVIQARGGSKGIPKKNIYPINGYPLISYTIAAARKSNLITDLVVSTDAEDIANVAKSYGAEVPFMRPSSLAGDKVLSVDSLQHAVLETESCFDKKYDYIIELPCVSPLRDHEDIDEALDLLISSGGDSVISVVNTGEKHPVRLKKIIDNKIYDFTDEYPEPGQNSRRQDLDPPAFIRNGAIYAMTRRVLIEEKSRHGENSLAYEMSNNKSENIDELEDLKIVEYKIKNGDCNNNPWEFKKNKVILAERNSAKTVLVSTSIHFLPEIKKQLEDQYSCIFLQSDNGEEIKDIFKNHKIEGWICSPTPKFKIDKNFLLNAKNLEIIVTPSTGSNHINKADCKKLNISVKALKGTDFVKQIYASSEFAFALLLAVVRNLPQAHMAALSYKWREAEDEFRGVELYGKNLGIIGFGRIGSNIARFSSEMGMNIYGYDPYIKISDEYTQLDNYQELLQKVDILVIAVHLDETTENLVDAKWFDSMKKGVYFINISRGEIVDEDALIESLNNGKVKSAGVDVIRNEISTEIKSSKLIKYAKENNNLIITPHVAGLSIESEQKAAQYSLDSLSEFFLNNS